MKGLARKGDKVDGGAHCHGHSHGLQPAGGDLIQGSGKVFVEGKPVARNGDLGFSPTCCGQIGRIEVKATPSKLWVDGKPVAVKGTLTTHCNMAPGFISGGSTKVFLK
jgi:uncharacterized Zn-binding protein involved in type VI secretion